MVAPEGPQFASETLSRLANLEQSANEIGGIESELIAIGTSMSETNQLQNNIHVLMHSKISIILAAQRSTYRNKERVVLNGRS